MAVTIGLTGGIATGKSVVAKMFRQKGARIIDADKVARQVVEPGEPALAEIVAAFGQKVLATNGELDRKALARVVFGNKEKLSLLNRITHPKMLKVIRQQMVEYRRAGVGVIVIDAPLLVEAGLHRMVDKVVVTTASEPTQIARLKDRDRLSREDALRRIRSQTPQAERVRWADYVINTDCPFAEVTEQAQRVWEEICREKDACADRP